MMMNRERIGFWVRLVSILLAAVFLISFIFLGVGTNLQYNVFDLFGNQDQPKQQQDQARWRRPAVRAASHARVPRAHRAAPAVARAAFRAEPRRSYCQERRR